MTNKQVCECCGQTVSPRRERVSKGIVKTLYKMAVVINTIGLNKVHPRNDLLLTKSEYNNFQKLRYHGLIAKYKIAGEIIPGYWLITFKGYNFLNEATATASYVEVLNNRVVGYSDNFVTYSEVAKEDATAFMEISTIEYVNNK